MINLSILRRREVIPCAMLDKVITSLTPNYNKLRSKTVFFILFAVSFLIRFPFFFRDYIDRDESTFILVAQSWVDGHLPYTELWDVKPPITFLYFAAIIYSFGKSIFAIRLFGALLVAVSSFFTFKIGSAIFSKKIGFWCAIAAVALLSMFGSLQGVMSEHITMAFFMPALYLLIRHKGFLVILSAGILMGLAVMTKLNMAYAILFLGLYLLYMDFRDKKRGRGIRNAVAYGFGIILIILLTILPYYQNDIVNLWWQSVVEAPLKYSGARRYSIIGMAPIVVIPCLFLYWAWKKKYIDFKNTSIQILLVAMVGVVLSFIRGGRVNGHYLIQLHPILILLVGFTISQLVSFQKKVSRKVVFLLILLLPMETYLEYGAILKNKWERGTFYNGEGFTVPKYLKENKINSENILFLGYHIGYWVVGENPPTKAATHPSNICKEEMFPFYGNPRKKVMEELKFIMDSIKPRTVVIRKNRSIFDKDFIAENNYINAYLEDYYKEPITVDKAEIYYRSERQ